MNIPQQLVDQIQKRRCVVFVGAGLSLGAGLPTWGRLMWDLLEHLESIQGELSDRKVWESLIEDQQYLLVADALQKRFNTPDAFTSFMVEKFANDNLEVQETHHLIAQLPFVGALTTNYDPLLEAAYRIRPTVYTQQDVEIGALLNTDQFYVAKIHGDIARPETLVLGKSDYRRIIHQNLHYQTFIKTIFLSKTVLFLGFSLSDPDLQLFTEELITIFHGQTGRHYALMSVDNIRTEIEIDDFSNSHNIDIIPYKPSDPSHPEVSQFLKELNHRVKILNVDSTVQEVERWDRRSPYPGLRSFDEFESPIFFGRDSEIFALRERLETQKLVVVVGASGSGKSSLVRAGLIPFMNHDKSVWHTIRLVPGESPRENLCDALRTNELFASTNITPNNVYNTLPLTFERVLASLNDSTKVLLFIDQFEELFTLVTDVAEHHKFLAFLTHKMKNVRVILTIRADFYHYLVPYLEEELRDGTFTIAKPSSSAMLEMIRKPADLAGIELEDGLDSRIVAEIRDEPGALALMAYLLDELYNFAISDVDRYMTHEEYEALGGVNRVIGIQAEKSFIALKQLRDPARTMQRIFRRLIEVDENGIVTRRQITIDPQLETQDVLEFIEAFTNARLLTSSTRQQRTIIEVSHEAVLREWERLHDWIIQKQEDLRLIRQFEREAELWDRNGKPDHLRPQHEQLRLFYAAIQRLELQSENDLSNLVQDYTESEDIRLIRRIHSEVLTHKQRSEIGKRLAQIGDGRPGVSINTEGIPDFKWIHISGNQTISDFYIGKYPVTQIQFQAYNKVAKLIEIPSKRSNQPSNVPDITGNIPITEVSWFNADTFAQWLTTKLNGERILYPEGSGQEALIIGQNVIVRLPSREEWLHAAQFNNHELQYPWGEWNQEKANTAESGLGELISVGMYPDGASKTGVYDMCGNVWEWCYDEYRQNYCIQLGGSYLDEHLDASCTTIGFDTPTHASICSGFRLVVGKPLLLDSDT